MWTTICTKARPMMTRAVVWVSPSAPVITAQNGIAVRITDSTNPII